MGIPVNLSCNQTHVLDAKQMINTKEIKTNLTFAILK